MAEDLFSSAGLSDAVAAPLAERLRPARLQDVSGQDHLVGPVGSLTKLLAGPRLPSLILWGPPGVGKTTIARVLADEAQLAYAPISAVFSGVKDLRAVFEAAESRRQVGQGTLLFVDEIHRFNRAQQDSFLPYVENGSVTLVGATTENPSFEINSALLSRCTVLTLHRLDEAALKTLLQKAEAALGGPLPLVAEARSALIDMADGDGRVLLNLAEHLASLGPQSAPLDTAGLAAFLDKRPPVYDKSGEGHYNLISALHKAVRGSDPDAALYWFARMLEGGEDPLYLGRRLVRMASEDIGAADPSALSLAGEAVRSYERLGSPEGELALAQAVLHLAAAPKSNAVYTAYKAARKLASETGSLPPPKHILNAPTQLMKDQGYGGGYEYDHDVEGAFSGQDYFPEGLARPSIYAPTSEGEEAAVKARVQMWAEIRARRTSEP